MNYQSYDSIWKELREILLRESLEIVYEDFEQYPGDLKEGEYRLSAPNKIYIDKMYEPKDSNTLNKEPLVIAHEVGHYFDLKNDSSLSVSITVREARANDFMVELSKKHGLLEDALKEREWR